MTSPGYSARPLRVLHPTSAGRGAAASTRRTSHCAMAGGMCAVPRAHRWTKAGWQLSCAASAVPLQPSTAMQSRRAAGDMDTA